MTCDTRYIVHFYKDDYGRSMALEKASPSETSSVYSEILFFGLFVSRTLLRVKGHRLVGEWLSNWLGLAISISQGTLQNPTGFVVDLERHHETHFRGEPGIAQIVATLGMRSTSVLDYSFDVAEKGRFGLFGHSSKWVDAMACLWGSLAIGREFDWRYLHALSMTGLLMGNAFVEGKLSLRSEQKVISDAIGEVIQLQQVQWPTQFAEKLNTVVELATTAAEGGDSRAQYYLAAAHVLGEGVQKDLSKAFQWNMKAAAQGHTVAQTELGTMYYQGLAVKQDYKSAFMWFRSAAERGDTWAQDYLGKMYETGKGVTQDFAMAAEWYRKAAKQGNSKAQYDLAVLYKDGMGVPKDMKEAVRWLHKAAKQGMMEAQIGLAVLCERSGNIKEAREWYFLAAEQGDEKSMQKLGELL